ncbi:MAG: hypothetical protein MI799_02180 [Desulfobacterales bacterium]|nr:hypothetical protein [Desulfobacterales bacterium]
MKHIGIKNNVIRWYVIRAEQYIKAFSDKRLTDHGPKDVEGYLAQQGRTDGIEDWQFRQVVDAIQNLFAMLGVAWLPEVDWTFWMDSATSLTKSHQRLQTGFRLKTPLSTSHI